ncbi:hypothetical protein OAW28_05510 [Alphaproteobacteria bacterium]|nr:hypothetical protein [Alphaproteobacteria bacterium]
MRTKLEVKAAKSAAALSDRLERYWDSLRMKMFYSKELGLTTLPPNQQAFHNTFTMSDALALYHRLKGKGKTKLFFEASECSIRYLSECMGHENLTALEMSDAGRFRNYLFNKGSSSSSVKRVFSSVRAVGNIAIKEHGIATRNVFGGTFIPDDKVKKQRLPLPDNILVAVQEECMHLDDEPRWLIALISDAGMRLAEAAGLLFELLITGHLLRFLVFFIQRYLIPLLISLDASEIDLTIWSGFPRRLSQLKPDLLTQIVLKPNAPAPHTSQLFEEKKVTSLGEQLNLSVTSR